MLENFFFFCEIYWMKGGLMTMRFVYCRSFSVGLVLINDFIKGDRRKVRLLVVCFILCYCRRKVIFVFIVKEYYEYLYF